MLWCQMGTTFCQKTLMHHCNILNLYWLHSRSLSIHMCFLVGDFWGCRIFIIGFEQCIVYSSEAVYVFIGLGRRGEKVFSCYTVWCLRNWTYLNLKPEDLTQKIKATLESVPWDSLFWLTSTFLIQLVITKVVHFSCMLPQWLCELDFGIFFSSLIKI